MFDVHLSRQLCAYGVGRRAQYFVFPLKMMPKVEKIFLKSRFLLLGEVLKMCHILPGLK